MVNCPSTWFVMILASNPGGEIQCWEPYIGLVDPKVLEKKGRQDDLISEENPYPRPCTTLSPHSSRTTHGGKRGVKGRMSNRG